MYILLLWTSYYAIVGNLEFLIRWAKGSWECCGLNSCPRWLRINHCRCISFKCQQRHHFQNKTFIHEEFPANENLLIHQGDTVQMGDYWVSWTGQEEEGYYLNYVLEFFEEQGDKLVSTFDLKPRIQLNERMGNALQNLLQSTSSLEIYIPTLPTLISALWRK